MPRAHSIDPQDALDKARTLLESGEKKVSSDVSKTHAYAHLADVYVRLAHAQDAVNASKLFNRM